MNGAIWCVSDRNGGDHYFKRSVLSAISFKVNNPDCQTALFCTEKHHSDEVFDHYFHIPPDSPFLQGATEYIEKISPTKRFTSLKMHCSTNSPFNKTIHLDADTLVCGNLSEIFTLLDEFDLLFTASDMTLKDSAGNNIGCRKLTMPNAVNSGVFAFSKNEMTRRLLGEDWPQKVYEWRIGEQDVLTRFVRKPDIYMKNIRWGVLDNTLYNATRRMWLAMDHIGIFHEAKILHFNDYDALHQVFLSGFKKELLLNHGKVASCLPSFVEFPSRSALDVVSPVILGNLGSSSDADDRR